MFDIIQMFVTAAVSNVLSKSEADAGQPMFCWWLAEYRTDTLSYSYLATVLYCTTGVYTYIVYSEYLVL